MEQRTGRGTGQLLETPEADRLWPCQFRFTPASGALSCVETLAFVSSIGSALVCSHLRTSEKKTVTVIVAIAIGSFPVNDDFPLKG